MTKKTNNRNSTNYQLLIIGSVFVILALSIFNIALAYRTPNTPVLGLKTVLNSNQALLQEKFFWESLLEENPTYLSGWVELAKIEIQLENLEAAKKAILTAFEINPNSIEVKNILTLFERGSH